MSLQTVSRGKLAISSNMFLIILNHRFFKDLLLGMSQTGRPPPGKSHVNAPKLGVLEQLKENVTISLTWLVTFFSEIDELWLTFSKNFEQAPNLENCRPYG